MAIRSRWDYCTLNNGNNIPLMRGLLFHYFRLGPSTTSALVINNSSHAFSIYLNINRLLLGNSEHKIQNYEVVDYHYCCSYHCWNLRCTKLQGWRKRRRILFWCSCWRNGLWLCYLRNIFSRRWIDTFI